MARTLTLLLSMLALLAAGCGGDDGGGDGGNGGGQLSKAEYTRQVQGVRDTLQQTFTKIGNDLSAAKSPRAIGAELEKGADALDQAVGRLAKVEPPEAASSGHQKIVSGMRAFAAQMHETAEQAAGGDQQGLAKALTELSSGDAARKVQEGSDELEKAGFKFQGS